MELPRLTVLNERFAIRSVLGKLGPFETTYLAWDLENEEQVIIREYLPVDLAKRDERGIGLSAKSTEAEELFQYGLGRIAKEAALSARINHPNVVKERGHFKENGTIYRVLDYHPGASLSYVLEQQGGEVSPRTAVTIMMPLLDGIRAGHAQGLVHGAISPDKIYLTKSGRPMLLSFKTTHLLLAQRTQSLVDFQQPGFSPPEQYTPRGKHGPWSDVYGAAATLFKMLSGNQLPAIPARLREDIIPALIDQSFELSLGTRNALKSALDMNITRRPQTIDAFRALLVDGFDLNGAHVSSPDEAPAKESFSQQTKITAPQPDLVREPVAKPAPVEPEHAAPEPVHFGIKQRETPVSIPVAKKPAPVEQLHFDSESISREPISGRVGDGSMGNGSIDNGSMDISTTRNDVFAEHFDTSVVGYNPLAIPDKQRAASTPAVYDYDPPEVEEKPWDNNSGFSSHKKLEFKRNTRRKAIISVAAGVFITLTALFAYSLFQEKQATSYDPGSSGYSAALLKGDSLYTLGEDVFKTDNSEAARSLFVNAREQYRLALTLSQGDKRTLRQRIDSVDAYLSVPVDVELDEKESLAHISRGDSIMRVADVMTLDGDSVEARELYIRAREEYLEVLDVRPDDSLALARFKQASQNMVAPVAAAPPPVLFAPVVSEEERSRQLYMQFKIRGDSAFDLNNFSEARQRFAEALIHKPNDDHASRRIQQIDQRLQQTERLGKYRQYMNSGNRLKSSGRMEEARREFVLALQFLPDDEAANSAIFQIDTLIDQQQKREDDYLSHKSRGEALLEKEDYEGALDSFKSALAAKPDDEYASKKAKEIQESLSSLAKQEDELPEGMVDDNGIYNFTEESPELVGGREVLQSRLRYPPKALEARIQGRVSVRMIVDETGRMLNPKILKGIRYDMDAEVMRVIRGARFEPGRVGGQPVKSWYTLYFEFKLDDEE